MQLSAFTIWQLGLSNKSYPDYLKHVGLVEPETAPSPMQRAAEKQAALANAARIIDLDTKRKERIDQQQQQ